MMIMCRLDFLIEGNLFVLDLLKTPDYLALFTVEYLVFTKLGDEPVIFHLFFWLLKESTDSNNLS